MRLVLVALVALAALTATAPAEAHTDVALAEGCTTLGAGGAITRGHVDLVVHAAGNCVDVGASV